jgi:hypothetical protein
MNDLDLITQLQPDEPLAGARELAPARRRLTDAIAAELSPAQAPAAVHPIFEQQRLTPPAVPSRPVRPGPRPAFAIVALTAAAAGVAAAVLIAIPGARRHQSAGPSTHPAQASRVKPFTGQLTAARFLDAAAQAALTQPANPPRPGQFVYAETEGPPGNPKNQIWQSADGSQPGLSINTTPGRWVVSGALNPCTVAQAEATHCPATAGYLPGLPVRPGRMLAYLTKVGLADAADQPGSSQHKNIPNWVANDIGKTLTVLLTDTYLRPDQRAALYEFMARTPGFTAAAHAVDALGRPGVGIRWTYEGTVSTLIFGRRDYAYLGTSSTYHGQSTYNVALVRFAIVDRLPPHATPTPPAKSVLKGKPRPTLSPFVIPRMINRARRRP